MRGTQLHHACSGVLTDLQPAHLHGGKVLGVGVEEGVGVEGWR
jgi:hypothetical protein